MERPYNSIGEYDKNNNLVKYLEFTDDQEYIKCSYNVKGNILERTQLQDYRFTDDPCTETLSSVLEYKDNIMLFSLRLDGETYIEPIISGQSYTRASIVNSVFSCQPEHENNAYVEHTTIKSNLIDDYLNKL